MNSPPQRPIAVWIALTVLALNTLLLLLLPFVPPFDESVLNAPEVSETIIDAVEVAAVIVSLVVAFWALANRRQWGRWFVTAPLVYLIGVLAWEQIFLTGVDPDLLVGATFVLSPLVLVILLVSFGDDVKKYFSAAAVSNNPTDSSENRGSGV